MTQTNRIADGGAGQPACRGRWNWRNALAGLARFGADGAGSIAIIGSLTLPVVVGGMALGAEVGLWYQTQRQLQHAADAAAHGAGIRKRQCDDDSKVHSTALALATTAGFDDAIGSIAVNLPPTAGPNAGNARAVEVILSETIPRYFSSIFSQEPVVVDARAVTLYTNPSSACVLALALTESAALKVSGSANVNLIDCDTASNSMASDAFDMNGASQYATRCVHTVGHAQSTSGLSLTGCPAVEELSGLTPDPYAGKPMPVMMGPCHGKNVGHPVQSTDVTATTHHSSFTESGLRSMRFCNGLQLKGIVHFDPGIYLIEGGNFSINAGAQVTGDNVMFFFGDGAASKLNGNALINLTPPNSGIYSGMLFFGDRGAAMADHHVNGSSGTSFGGAIYFPSQKITYNGGAGATGGCTQIIGYMIEFNGNSDLSLDCDGVGVEDINVAGNVEIVE